MLNLFKNDFFFFPPLHTFFSLHMMQLMHDFWKSLAELTLTVHKFLCALSS